MHVTTRTQTRRHTHGGDIPELKWFASKSLALPLLATALHHGVNGGQLLSQVAALPQHLRQSVLWFLVRTGQPHREGGFGLTDDMLAACVRGSADLDLGGADYLGGVAAFELVRGCCPALTELDMSRWQRRDAIGALASGHARLREINLARCTGSVNDAHILSITRHSPLLEKVDFSHNELVTDEGLFSLASNCHRLRAVHLNCCFRITDVGLSSLLMATQRKAGSSIGGIGNGTACSQLTELGLKRLVDIDKALNVLLYASEDTDPGIPHIQKVNAKSLSNVPADTWTQLLAPSLLTVLELKLGETAVDFAAIVEQGLAGDSEGVCNLKVLDLSWNDEVDEDSVCQVVERSPQLETLKLRACETLGTRAVIAAALSCLNLKKINVARCNHVSDAAVVALAQHCSRLRDVNVAWSDCGVAGAAALLGMCRELTHLSISGCKTITQEGIEAAVVSHPALRWVDASWVNAISESAARAFVAQRKASAPNVSLEVVDYYNESAR